MTIILEVAPRPLGCGKPALWSGPFVIDPTRTRVLVAVADDELVDATRWEPYVAHARTMTYATTAQRLAFLRKVRDPDLWHSTVPLTRQQLLFLHIDLLIGAPYVTDLERGAGRLRWEPKGTPAWRLGKAIGDALTYARHRFDLGGRLPGACRRNRNRRSMEPS